MEILDRAEALLDRLIATQNGTAGGDGNGHSNATGQASPLTVYLSTVPEAERNDRATELQRSLGLCAGCTALVVRDKHKGCAHPETAALGQAWPVEAYGHFERAEVSAE